LGFHPDNFFQGHQPPAGEINRVKFASVCSPAQQVLRNGPPGREFRKRKQGLLGWNHQLSSHLFMPLLVSEIGLTVTGMTYSVSGMNRKHRQPVTDVEKVSDALTNALPVLVPCRAEDRDGIANFFQIDVSQDELEKRTQSDNRPIRRLTITDLDPDRIEQALGEEMGFYSALLDLGQGLQQNDPIQRARGMEKIYGKGFGLMGQIPDFARHKFPVLVTSRLKDVRLVLWWTEPRGRVALAPGWAKHKGKIKTLTPALFCPDLPTALFLKAYLGEVRCCPYCGGLFVPRASNIMYCTTAHRDAHRMNRYRRLKKATEQRQKRTAPLPRTLTKGVPRGKR